MNSRQQRALLDLFPVAIGCWLLAALIGIWSQRVGYPFDLEWMEGGMLAHAWRVEQGLPLYVEPGPDWIPYIYPPGYSWLLAAAGDVFGLTHATGRLLSLAGVLAASGAIVFAVRRQTQQWTAGLFGAFAFLGCYPHSGAFYDLVRLDGVFIGLFAWCVALALEEDRRAQALSGLLLFAAFMFKQSVAAFGLPIAIALLVRGGWRQALAFFAWSGAPALAVTGYMQWASGGVYLKYLLAVPASHPIVGARTYPGTLRELGWALGLVCLLCGIWLVARGVQHLREHNLNHVPLLLIATLLGVVGGALDWYLPVVRGIPKIPLWQGLFASFSVWAGAAVAVVLLVQCGRSLSWRWVFGLGLGCTVLLLDAVMRGHHGGFLNVHMQAYWVICLAGAYATARARASGNLMVHGATAALFTVQLAVQFFALNPEQLVPTDRDRVAGNEVVDALRSVEGPVLSAYAPWMSHQAGHQPGFHLIALWDVTHKGSPFPAARGMISDAAEAQHWGGALTGKRSYKFHFDRNYKQDLRFTWEPKVLSTRSGWGTRPTGVWTRQRSRE